MFDPLFWCFMPIGPGVPVYLSHHTITPELVGCYAITIEHPEIGLVIYIDAAQPRERQNRVYTHEFVHCCLWGKKSLKLHHKKEEQIADEIGTTGWRCLRIPRRPKGAIALESYARGYEEKLDKKRT